MKKVYMICEDLENYHHGELDIECMFLGNLGVFFTHDAAQKRCDELNESIEGNPDFVECLYYVREVKVRD